MTQSFEFGEFRLELEERRLLCQGRELSLPPKLFDTLALLVQKPGHLITKEEFLNVLWPDTFVGEDTLAQNISLLRKVLSQGANGQEYVATIPKRGYRFVAHVTANPVVGQPVSEAAPADANNSGRSPHAAGGHDVILSSPNPSASQLAPLRTEKQRFRLRWMSVVAVSSIVGLSAGVATFLVLRRQPPTSMKALSFVQLTNDGHAKEGPLRADGTRIYATEYVTELRSALVQISIKGRDLTSFPTPLRKPRVADISPDGTELLLLNDELSGPPSLWIQSVIGGDPRRVGDLIADNASWGPDDETIAYTKGQEIYVAKKDGALSRKLLTVPGFPSDLKFSPDATKLRFTLAEGQDRTTSLWEASANGSQPHSLLPEWNAAGSECCGAWTSDGKHYVFQSWQSGRREIWAIQEDATALSKTRRAPEQLTAGPMDFSYPIAGKDGHELFAIGALQRAEVVRYDLREHRFIPYLPGISAEGLDFSKDGKWVTYTSYPEGTLWRSRVDGTDRRQLTFSDIRVLLPRWSPDGKQIAFTSSPRTPSWKLGGPWKIYLISTEGGSPQQLLPGETNEVDPTWSPDGTSIVFGGLPWPETSGKDHADLNIQVVDLKTRQVSKLPDSDGLYSPRWSPDGRYIFASTSSHPMKPLLFSLASKKWTRLAEGELGYPSWSRDSKFIYLQDWNHGSPRISRLRLSDHTLEVLMEFSDVKSPLVGFITPWSGVALDGSPLVARDTSNQEIYALKLSAP